jgi:hypothetical protein
MYDPSNVVGGGGLTWQKWLDLDHCICRLLVLNVSN